MLENKDLFQQGKGWNKGSIPTLPGEFIVIERAGLAIKDRLLPYSEQKALEEVIIDKSNISEGVEEKGIVQWYFLGWIVL